MYFINTTKCIDTDYLEKSCSDAITVTRQADYSLIYFGLGTPYPEPRSQFELSVHVSFSPFHGVFSYCSGAQEVEEAIKYIALLSLDLKGKD